MSGELAAVVQTVLEWIKAPWKMFTIIFVISIFALLAPESWLRAIHMADWINGHWAELFLCSAFSGLFLVITGIEKRVQPILALRRHKHEINEKCDKIVRTLKSLKPDERGALTYFNGHSTYSFHPDDSVIRNLEIKGIVRLVIDTNYQISYSLGEDVLVFLEERGHSTIGEAIAKLK